MKKISTKYLSIIVISSIFMAVIFSLLQVRHFGDLFSSDIEKLFPKKHPLVSQTEELDKSFTAQSREQQLVIRISEKSEQALVLRSNLESIELFRASLAKFGYEDVVGFDKIEFAFEKNQEIQFGTIGETSLNQETIDSLLGNSIFVPRLISKDAKYANLYIKTKLAPSKKQMQAIKEAASKFHLNVVSFLHPGLISKQVQTSLGKETSRNLVFGFIVLLLMSYALYKSKWAYLFHGASYITSLILVFGILSYFKISLNTLSVTLPIILLITQISLASHLLPQIGRKPLLYIIKENSLPTFIALFSTWLGFGSLYYSDSLLLKEYSLTSIIGISTSSVCFFLFYTVLSVQEGVFIESRKLSFLNNLKFRIHLFLNDMGNTVLFVFSCLFVISLGLASYTKFNWNGPRTQLLEQKSPISKILEDYKKEVRGRQNYFISIKTEEEGFWERPQNLLQLEKILTSWKNENPEVISVSSFIDQVKLFRKDARLPKDARELSEIAFMMGMMGVDTNQYTSTSKKAMRLEVQASFDDYNQMNLKEEKLLNHLEKGFGGSVVRSYGKTHLKKHLEIDMAKSLYFGFLSTFGLVLLSLLVLWRRFDIVLLAGLPNLIPIAAINIFLAKMGWTFDPVIAIIYSIAVGLSFDNTIFYINDLLKDKKPNALKSFHRKFEDISTSSLCLIASFSLFLFSSNQVNFNFGILMILGLVVAYIADSIFLPSLFCRKFSASSELKQTKNRGAFVPNNDEFLPEEKNYEIAA